MVVTMREIAKLADVDISTVSKVLNNCPKISLKTSEKILKLVNKLDYFPNMSARRLRKQRTFTIGVCIPSIGAGMFSHDYLYNEFLQGIVTIFKEDSGYDILLQPPHVRENRYNYVRLFDQQKVDGVIVIFPKVEDPGLKELEERGVSAVLISTKSSKLDYVDIDNAGGAYKAVEHLVKLGHKRIGMIAVIGREVDFQERFNAYKSALLKNGLPYTEELVAHVESTETAGYEGMKKLLVHKPTAVFAADDRRARKAIDAILEAGLRVPEDIAVVGFDDNPFFTASVPTLTTIRQSYSELAKRAAKMLLDRIEGRVKKQQKKIVPCELIVRESSGRKQ
jgi:LacI family transcriptional regulator